MFERWEESGVDARKSANWWGFNRVFVIVGRYGADFRFDGWILRFGTREVHDGVLFRDTGGNCVYNSDVDGRVTGRESEIQLEFIGVEGEGEV